MFKLSMTYIKKLLLLSMGKIKEVLVSNYELFRCVFSSANKQVVFWLGYGFAIRKMSANDTSDKKKLNNPYAQDYIGVEKFLDIISLEPTYSDEVCLSHVFTYRDFEDGVLGLAWVAEPCKLVWFNIFVSALQ